MSRQYPSDPSCQQNHSAVLFCNTENPVFHGGNFTNIGGNFTNISAPEKSGFYILQEHVAPAAFHNSKQRVNPPRCHKHTREAVLDEIYDWIFGTVDRETWITWLNGAAGAGKSAICQSIAERCILHGIMVASFFFFRTDSTRNTIDPLVATLAYQIIQLIPETKKYIVETIECNPLIFEQTFETQINLLIARPLCLLQVSDPAWKILLIIDGVDECNDENIQMNLIRTIANLLKTKNIPLIVLFGSRRENQIQMAFNSREMGGILNRLPLDDNYHPEEDIRRFINDSFREIKQTHPFGKSLEDNWPPPDHVQEIVNKSSGQFIYASVVIHFLSAPSANPSVRLDIIRGLRPSGRLTPFAQLDALYRHIFSQVDDISKALELLAYVVFGQTDTLKTTLHFFDFADADAQSILTPLAPVLICDLDGCHKITFRHASLSDFLRDKVRSREYCINSFATSLPVRWFKMAESGHFRDLSWVEQNLDIPELLQHAEATTELYASLILYTPSQQPSAYNWTRYPGHFLTIIRNMEFGDSGEVYRNHLNTIVRYVAKVAPGSVSEIAKTHDISQILAQFISEETSPGTLPMETPSAMCLSPSIGNNEELSHHPRVLSQVDDAREFGEISTTSESHGLVGANALPSKTPLTHSSRIEMRAMGLNIKTWLVKWGHSFMLWILYGILVPFTAV